MKQITFNLPDEGSPEAERVRRRLKKFMSMVAPRDSLGRKIRDGRIKHVSNNRLMRYTYSVLKKHGALPDRDLIIEAINEDEVLKQNVRPDNVGRASSDGALGRFRRDRPTSYCATPRRRLRR